MRPPPGSGYVALGSSFAAGPGIPPLVQRGAFRSGANYPHLLAAAGRLDLTDATCSGATTAHLVDTPQRTLTGTLPPQLASVAADTALVTITAGGNDLGYLGMLTTAALRGTLAGALPGIVDKALGGLLGGLRGTVAVPAPARFTEVETALVGVVAAVRRRAPDARVVLVDYLTVLGRHTTPESCGLTAEQIDRGRATGDGLAAATARAAVASGAELVAMSRAGADHGVGAPDPWVGGVALGLPFLGGPVPFHPTATGMRQVADALVAALV